MRLGLRGSVTSSGYTNDANGNLTAIPFQLLSVTYDVENRVSTASPSGGGTESYSYGPDNQRVFKLKTDTTKELHFYGAYGERLLKYNLSIGETIERAAYFGTRQLFKVQKIHGQPINWSMGGVMMWDRLETAGTTVYPYGEGNQGNEEEGFATYFGDASTGLDYARNRYYSSALGRFTSPDRYLNSAGPADPGSWNRYVYAGDDPVNFNDPSGLSLICVGYGNTYGNGSGASNCYWDPYSADQASPPETPGPNGCPSGESFAPGDPTPDPECQSESSPSSPPPPTCSIELWERPAFFSKNRGHYTYLLVDDPVLGLDNVMIEGGPDHEPGPQHGTLMGFENPAGQGLGQGSGHASDPFAFNNHEIGRPDVGTGVCGQVEEVLYDVGFYNAGHRVQYYPLGQYNSNSFTYTLLSNIDLSGYFGKLPTHFNPLFPTRPFYPGWNEIVPGL